MQNMKSFFHFETWIELLIERSLKVLVIIAGVFVCAKLIHVICMRILDVAHENKDGSDSFKSERDKRLATVVKLVDTTLRVGLFSTATLMALREFGLDISPLLTGAGIAGVALGFGAQSLVKDVISGFFLLIENQIRLGDVVKVNNGLSGSVERMELRVTAIRDGDGTLHIIPNGEIKSVSNMTYQFAQSVIEIPVAYQTDIQLLDSVLKTVAEEFATDTRWKTELIGRPDFIGITEFKSHHMVVQLSAKTVPHSRWAVSRELRQRCKVALDKAGIQLPKPALM